MNTKSLSFLTDPLDPPKEAPKNVLPAFPKPGKNKDTPPPKEVLPQAESPQDLPTGTEVVEAPSSENVQNQNFPLGDETKVLPLDLIDPPTISQRQAYPREMVDRMATAIRRQAQGKPDILDGQIHPIIVVPHPTTPGRYQIVDGFTRYRAFSEQFLSDRIKITVRHGLTPADIFAMSFSANVERNGTTDFDRGMALADALKLGFYKDKLAIATRLGVDPKVVTGLMAFSSFPESVLEQVRSEPERFSYNTANRLLSLINKNAPEDQVVAVAKKVRDGSMTYAKLNKLVTDYEHENKKQSRPRRDTRNILGYGKVKATDNAVVLDLSSLPMSLGPKLADSLQEFVVDFLKNNIPSEQIVGNSEQVVGNSEQVVGGDDE